VRLKGISEGGFCRLIISIRLPWEKNLTDLKILSCMVTSCNVTSKMSPSIVTNCNVDGDKMSSCMVQKLYLNNNNLINKKKSAAAVTVNFKKLKEKMRRIRKCLKGS